MEIGIISPINAFPPNYGGAVRIFHIAKNLGESGHIVHLFIPEGKVSLDLKNVKVYQSKELNKDYQWYPIDIPAFKRVFESLTRLMKRLRYYKQIDIIQSELLLTAPHGLMLKNLMRKPAILDEHNVETLLRYRISGVEKKRWKKLRLLEKLACKNFDHILTVSSFDKRVVQALFSVKPSKITVAPNGVDIQHFSPKSADRERVRSKYGLKDEPVILFTGRLSWFPNADAIKVILSEIYPALKKLMSETVFMIVGTKPPSWLINLKDKDLIVTGAVDDVVPYLNAADVCIAPLRFGSGTRLKILEFMACEKPVVSTTIGVEGLDVINGKHVIIEDNWMKFTERIAHLIENKQLAVKMGKSARILTQRQYDWKQIVPKLVSIYEKVAA